jgi:hypothetical protein
MARFSDLPAEVRNIMYEELLSGESQSKRRVQNELAMLTVSKQLHIEGSSYFYQNNEITVDAPSPVSDAATILPPIADKYLPFLRRLTIYTSTGQADLLITRKVASAIANLAIIGADLDALNISIASPFSHLLNSRVDDSIIDANHPIAVALLEVLQSGVAKFVRLELKNAWFGLGVTHALQSASGTQVEFYDNGAHTTDLSLLERPLTGRYSCTHLASLGLGNENVADIRLGNTNSVVSTPSSLPSSLCSAFADLDNFSVASFQFCSGPAEATELDFVESPTSDTGVVERPFFTDDDIEEWSASTHEDSPGQEAVMLGETDEIEEDEEMEDMGQDDRRVVMQNIEDAAHHVANSDDVTYMTNFAPDLLLSRHHLGHLV